MASTRKRPADDAEHPAKRATPIDRQLRELDYVCSSVETVCGGETALMYEDVCCANKYYLTTVAARALATATALFTHAEALAALAEQISEADVRELAHDCLVYIVEMLDSPSRTRLACTCKTFAKLVCSLNKRETAYISKAGHLIEEGSLVYHAARRYSRIAWRNVSQVTVDCTGIHTGFVKDKWADVQRFIEAHVMRIYPNALNVTLTSRLWPTFSLNAHYYRIKAPKGVEVLLNPSRPYHRPRYTQFVDPASMTALTISDAQNNEERKMRMELALFSGDTPNLRELHLRSEHWYSTLREIPTDWNRIGLPPRIFNCASEMTVFITEPAFQPAEYNADLIKQLLVHTAILSVRLNNPAAIPVHSKLSRALFAALVRLKDENGTKEKPYVPPIIYIRYTCVSMLHYSGVLLLGTLFPVYLVLESGIGTPLRALQQYFDTGCIDGSGGAAADTAKPRGHYKPPFLFFAVAENHAIKRVPRPHCETIEGAMNYSRLASGDE